MSVRASETRTSPGRPAHRATRSRRTPTRAQIRSRFAALDHQIRREQRREGRRRVRENRHLNRLRRRVRRCEARAAYHHARRFRRFRVVRQRYVTIRTTKRVRVPVTRIQRFRYRQRYRVAVTRWVRQRVDLGIVTVTVRRPVRVHVWRWRWAWGSRRVTVHVWRRVPVTRRVLRTYTRWETRGSRRSTVLARAYRRCAANAREKLTISERSIERRRRRADAERQELLDRAHALWTRLNTTCRNVRSTATHRIQRCEHGRWRSFEPESHTRRVRIRPPRPPTEVVERARDRVRAPTPEIRMNPKVEWEQIVHLPTWLWVERSSWRSRRARAEAGRAWAEATAEPTRVIWDMGNGDRVVCDGPGTPYDLRSSAARQSTDCSYTYERSSAGRPRDTYTVTATLVSDVSWRGSAGSGGDLGTITTKSTARIRVAEIQALRQ